MASIPEFLQESYNGLQKALEDKYKDLLLEHERIMSYRVLNEEHTQDYGKITIEDIKTNLNYSEDNSKYLIDFFDKYADKGDKWLIKVGILESGHTICIDNFAEMYIFPRITNEYACKETINKSFKKYDTNVNYLYNLSNKLINEIKLYKFTFMDHPQNVFNHIYPYRIHAENEYQFRIIKDQVRQLTEENKRLQELLDQQSQKAKKAVTTESPKNLFQRFQEKIKTF